jgi:hypothetical protein
VHEANIGAQFWSRTSAPTMPRVVSQEFGVVDPHDVTKAAVVSMNRTMDRHDTLAPGETAGDSTGRRHMFLSQQATDWKVNGLFAHKDMRHTVPALLGLAAIHSLKTSKKVPDASPYLSVASKRVVDRLVDAKLVRDPLKGMRSTFTPNSITSEAGGEHAFIKFIGKLPEDVAVPTPDSDHAADAVRNALGGSIAKKRAKKAKANRPRPHTPPDWRTPGLFDAEPYKVEKPKKARHG